MLNDQPIVIVGAGLAGLNCALSLQKHKLPYLILEAADEVGGRIRTDEVNGFLLDRGFQALQTAYPEAQQVLDYDQLNLESFEPGALIHKEGKFVRMIDPWRKPIQAIGSLNNGIGTLLDRWKIARMRMRITSSDPDGNEKSTASYLSENVGLSAEMIDCFFKPWFSGVFLEKDLDTSSHFFQFVFRMMAFGDVALPQKGMGAIPKQLASRLNQDQIRLNTRVIKIESNQVVLENGECLEASAIVLATDINTAQKLSSAIPEKQTCSVSCYYYSANEAPISDPILILNADKQGIINNLCVPSQLHASYAPEGKSLVSVSVLEEASEVEVRNELQQWFGATVCYWEHLRTYHIPHALPVQRSGYQTTQPATQLNNSLFCCGDYCETGSINGALASGRKTAELMMQNLKKAPC